MREMANSETAAGLSPRAVARKLKKTRREAQDFLKEAERLSRKHGKRLGREQQGQLEQALGSLREAIGGSDVERLGGALKKLDAFVEKHLGFARRSPAVEYVLSIGKALFIALLLRLFVVEAFKIPSGSMIPTLSIGDHIFVNKLSYGVRLPVINWDLLHWGGYRRGEIIVFVNPQDDARPFLDRRDYIKRIIGLPDDTVEVRDEVVLVNGVAQPRELLEERFAYFDRAGDNGPWIPAEAQLWKETLHGADGAPAVKHDVMRDEHRRHLAYEGPFKVPADHVFMMGDNRDNSQDGRTDGGWFVPFGHVKGRAVVIWLSLGKPGLWFWGESGVRFGRMFRGIQ
jgi:signal peptidase I